LAEWELAGWKRRAASDAVGEIGCEVLDGGLTQR